MASSASKGRHLKGRGILRIGRLGIEAPEEPSGDDAPMLAGEVGVGRDRSRRCEVEIALERKAEWAAGGSELVEAQAATAASAMPWTSDEPSHQPSVRGARGFAFSPPRRPSPANACRLIALETRPLLSHDPLGVRYSARIRRELIRLDGQDHRTGRKGELTPLPFLQQKPPNGLSPRTDLFRVGLVVVYTVGM